MPRNRARTKAADFHERVEIALPADLIAPSQKLANPLDPMTRHNLYCILIPWRVIGAAIVGNQCHLPIAVANHQDK